MQLQTWYFTSQISLTPTNIKKVSKIKELVSLLKNQILNLPKFTIIHKTFKAARYAITNKIILNDINTKLFAAYIRKKQQVQYINLQYNGQNAQVLSLKNVKKRRELVEEKKRDKKAKIEEKKQK